MTSVPLLVQRTKNGIRVKIRWRMEGEKKRSLSFSFPSFPASFLFCLRLMLSTGTHRRERLEIRKIGNVTYFNTLFLVVSTAWFPLTCPWKEFKRTVEGPIVRRAVKPTFSIYTMFHKLIWRILQVSSMQIWTLCSRDKNNISLDGYFQTWDHFLPPEQNFISSGHRVISSISSFKEPIFYSFLDSVEFR